MSADKMFEGFGDIAGAEYAEEAGERWGHTAAYRESMRRVKRYTKEDWTRLKAEPEVIEARWAALLAEGRSPEEDVVAEVAEDHRAAGLAAFVAAAIRTNAARR